MKNKTELFKNKYSAAIIALICVLLWGSAFPAVKTGYALFAIESQDISSKLLYAGIRFFSAGVMDLIVAGLMYRRVVLPQRQHIKAILSLGIVQTFLQYIFFYVALGNMAGSKGSVINAMGTFLTVFLAHFFCADDRMNQRKVLGCILGIAGIIVINLGGDMGDGFKLMGDGVMILAALSAAFGNIISKRVAGGMEAIWLTGYQLAAGGLMLIITGVCTGGRLTVVTPKGVLLMAYMAFLSAAAFTLWLMLFKYHPVGKISMYQALIPVFGTYLSGIVLGEPVFTWINTAALLLVAAGICITVGDWVPTGKSTFHKS